MRVKLLTGRVDNDGRVQAFGEIIDVPHLEATRMIATGVAVAFKMDEPEIPETAAFAPPENMARRRGRPRKTGVEHAVS